MKQATWSQIIALVILAILALFYDPRSADLEGKLIFFLSLIAAYHRENIDFVRINWGVKIEYHIRSSRIEIPF